MNPLLNSVAQEGTYESTGPLVYLDGPALDGAQTFAAGGAADGTSYIVKIVDKVDPSVWLLVEADYDDLATDQLSNFQTAIASSGALTDGSTVQVSQVISAQELLALAPTSVQTLTNKTLTDISNNVHANAVHFKIRCVEAGGISKGQAVAFSGWNDGQDALEVVLADNTAGVAIALAEQDLLVNENGLAIAAGVLTDLDTSSFVAGNILYVNSVGDLTSTEPTTGFSQPIAFVLRSHATNGDLQVLAAYPKQNADDVFIEGTSQSIKDYVDEKTPSIINGFADRSEVSLSWADATRTLTITPTGAGFTIYSNSIRFTFDSVQTFQIADTEGGHYIYFDASGDLQETTSFLPALIDTHCFACYVYWDATNGEAVPDAINELHGVDMDPVTHAYLHNTVGTVYQSGLGLTADSTGDGDTDSHAQFSAAAGVIWDEDIRHDIGDKLLTGTHRLAYRLGPNGDWRADTTAFLAKPGTSLAAFNEWTGTTWQLADVTNNDYFLAHVFAVPGLSDDWLVIMGQHQYSTESLAQTAAESELYDLIVGEIPVTEFAPVATFILQTGSGYSNTVKSRIRQTSEGDDFIDWRTKNAVASSGGGVSDHNALTGLQGGAVGEYYHLDAASATMLAEPEIQALASLTSAANKVPRFTGSGTADMLDFVDEDDMSSDSASAVPSQQSTKAYTDKFARARKNLIINGCFRFSQRGDYTSATAMVNGVYLLDRFKNTLSGVTATLTHMPAAADNGGLFLPSAKVIATSTATGYAGLRHYVENPEEFEGATIITRALVRSNSETARLLVSDNSAYSIAAHTGSGNWEWVTVTHTVSAAPTYLIISPRLSSGSGLGASLSSGDYIEVKYLQTEIGSEATDFEYRPIAEELALCQRYYQKSVGSNNGSCTFFSGDTVSSNWYYAGRSFQTEMRTAPTITLANFNAYGFLSTAGSVTDTSTQGFLETRQSNVTTNGAYFSSDWTADAEL